MNSKKLYLLVKSFFKEKFAEMFNGRDKRTLKQNVPHSLYWAPSDFFARCKKESNTDVRHLGRYLTFAYTCPKCGPRLVELPPNYPYCGPSSTWTCSYCAAVMCLDSVVPVKGTPKTVTLMSKIRDSE